MTSSGLSASSTLKNFPPNRRMLNLRTLESGRWGNNIDLEWLPPKIDEERTKGEDGCSTEPMEIDVDSRLDREHELITNNHTFNFYHNNFCTSSYSFLIFVIVVVVGLAIIIRKQTKQQSGGGLDSSENGCLRAEKYYHIFFNSIYCTSKLIAVESQRRLVVNKINKNYFKKRRICLIH